MERLSSSHLQREDVVHEAGVHIDGLYSEFNSWGARMSDECSRFQALHKQASPTSFWAAQEIDAARQEQMSRSSRLEQELNFVQAEEMKERAIVKELNLRCDQISAKSDDRIRIAIERLDVAQRGVSKLQSDANHASMLEQRLREDIARMRASKDALSATKDANEIELLRARLGLKEAEHKFDAC